MEQYNIGDVLLQWDGGGYGLAPGPFMEQFRWEGDWQGERIVLRGRYEPLTPYREYPLLLEQELFSVYDVNGEKLLLYHWSYLRDGYGIWLDRIAQGREDVCSFDPKMDTQLPMGADWFFGVSGLQKALLMKGRPVMHASCIAWKGRAILFTAPSGTGKSTQAGLWQQQENCRILNGDRALLGRREQRWHAYGYPNCGSSAICVNETLPLGAIVVLRQGRENRVEPMSVAEKLRALASAMVVYPWDPEDIRQAALLAGQLLTEVPVIRLTCRPDAEAVAVLKNYLQEVLL